MLLVSQNKGIFHTALRVTRMTAVLFLLSSVDFVTDVEGNMFEGEMNADFFRSQAFEGTY
jgi:hypothetical protein